MILFLQISCKARQGIVETAVSRLSYHPELCTGQIGEQMKVEKMNICSFVEVGKEFRSIKYA